MSIILVNFIYILLLISDEIYAFEQIREPGQPIWYRGLVHTLVRVKPA